MQKKLWLALVEHNAVPGVRFCLLRQPEEPSDEEILAAFESPVPKDQIYVSAVFDFANAIATSGPKSLAALRDALADPAFIQSLQP